MESTNISGKRGREDSPAKEAEVSSKRIITETPTPPTITIRPECPHGQECYRRNPFHFREYRHSARELDKHLNFF